MSQWIVMFVLGILIIALGCANRKGNISSIHWYHRKRVTEEDRVPFGRLVGLGTIIIGAAFLVSAALSFVAEQYENVVFSQIGGVITGAGLVVGLGISFYAMFKYNKGIF